MQSDTEYIDSILRTKTIDDAKEAMMLIAAKVVQSNSAMLDRFQKAQQQIMGLLDMITRLQDRIEKLET